MSSPVEETQHIEIFTKVLERFDDVFAIYDQNHKLVFANAAAHDAMPVYFKALSEGGELEFATRLQVMEKNPGQTEKVTKYLTDRMVELFHSEKAYEVEISNNRIMQVTHERLDDDYKLGLGIDVTKIKSQQIEMKTLAEDNLRLANTDQLTGLANRRQFMKTLNDTISEHQSTGSSFFVGSIDLNGFKRVNDLYGHAVGDDLLTGIAQRASDFIQDTTFLARLGGDEFALITHANESQLDLLSFSAGLCEVLRQPMCLNGNDINVSASLGWASYPHDGETASDLLRKSDYALYKSKQSEARRTVVFSMTDEKVMQRESKISRQFGTVKLEDELYLEFQPIIDTETKAITSLEALARWQSPTLGSVSPIDFIPIAEKTGRISDLSKIILKKALEQAIHWPKSIDLHVNISAVDLGKFDIMSEFIDIINLSAYPATSVVFEVTETAVVDTFESTPEVFDLLQDNGLRLALDDFGMGFSSLSYLSRIPVTHLKIDKHFTECLAPGSDDEKILKTILFLCENLEINCIVEGVENYSQYQQHLELGSTQMQGFFFSKSLTPPDLQTFMVQYAQTHTRMAQIKSLNRIGRVA